MGRRGAIRTALLLAAAVLLGAAHVARADDPDVRAAVERVFSSHRIQGDLPADPADPAGRSPADRSDDDASWSRGSPAPPGANVGGAASGLASALGWGALAVGLVLVLLWLAGLRQDRSALPAAAAPEPLPSKPAPRRELAAPTGVEERAAALAREGRVDEAVHVLLLDSTERVLAAAGRAAEVALTSREIAGASGLEARRVEAFNALVTLVERSRFAGRPLASDDFVAGRDAYRALAGAA